MDLRQYPRPAGDTGIGFHYDPAGGRPERQELARWLPRLRAMGTSWLVFRASLDEPVPEGFVRGLMDAGIEPVVLLDAGGVQPVEGLQLEYALRGYATAGLHYISIYPEPNVASHWPAVEWLQPGLVKRFADLLLPFLERAVDLGLFPLLSPLKPGGHYWDTAFLVGLVGEMLSRGRMVLFDRMGVAIENVAHNRPLDWGRGGPERWPQAGPYRVAEGYEDHQGFRLFEWYEQLLYPLLGGPLPLIAVASGPLLGSVEDGRFAVVDEAMHAERSLEMVRLLRTGELGEALFNLAFWTLTSDDDPSAWVRSDGSLLTAAALLSETPKHPRVRRDGARGAWARGPARRPLHHYLLFPPTGVVGSHGYWEAAKPYIERFGPCCGFRPEEAQEAAYVTLVGDETEIGREVERYLRAAGCRVERVAGGGPAETRRLLKRMAREGTRYLEG